MMKTIWNTINKVKNFLPIAAEPVSVFTVQKRFNDQFNESYVLKSDNNGKDLRLKEGQKVVIILLP